MKRTEKADHQNRRSIREIELNPEVDLDPSEVEIKPSLELLLRLFRETYRGHVKGYFLAFLSMCVMAGSTAGLAYLIKFAIDGVFQKQEYSIVCMIAGALFVLSILKGVSDYFQRVLMTTIGNALVAHLQLRAFEKILILRLDYIGRFHSSKLASKVTQNARVARTAITSAATTFGRDSLTVLGLTIVMFVQDPKLSIGALLIAPPVIIGIYGIVQRIRASAVGELGGMADILKSIQETLLGIKTVKSFSLESKMQERFASAVKGVESRSNRIIRIKAMISPLMETLGGFVVAILILYAGWQSVAAGKTPGEFMSFLTAFLLAYEPAKRLANVHVELQRDIVALGRIYGLLDLELTEETNGVVLQRSDVKGHVKFENVTFAYKRKPVLKAVSIEAKPGEVVALVGRSGAGKSTICALLEKFYEPRVGRIFIDGIDIATVQPGSLRKQVASVGQDTVMFSATVRENIRFGRLDATDEEVESAAAVAAADFINELPNQFDTELGERGFNLSGGQVQRIAIARAVLKDAPILVLDEATSAIDSDTEEKVKLAIQKLMVGRTTIVVAHRLSTIKDADRAYLIEAGRILAGGSHDELLAVSPLYRKLFGGNDLESGERDNLLEEFEIVST